VNVIGSFVALFELFFAVAVVRGVADTSCRRRQDVAAAAEREEWSRNAPWTWEAVPKG